MISHDLTYLHQTVNHAGLKMVLKDQNPAAFALSGEAFEPVVINERLDLGFRGGSRPDPAVRADGAGVDVLFVLKPLPAERLIEHVLDHVRDRRPENLVIYGPYSDINHHLNLYGDERTRVQDALIANGYARHPLDCADLLDYNRLDACVSFVSILARRTEQAETAWPVSVVKAERDLHMDMLLEGHRRADAHTIRYVLASRFISPGDTVVDAACGMGYGLEVMRALGGPLSITAVDISEFACNIGRDLHLKSDRDRVVCGDAANMAFIDDQSVDVVSSFETIEHVIDCEGLLAEFRRILKVGGRLVASVPNLWVDETGNDPNPDHHHVFEWPKFLDLITRSGFTVESAWSQNAGGALREPFRLRQFMQVSVESPPATSEWCVVSAIRQ